MVSSTTQQTQKTMDKDTLKGDPAAGRRQDSLTLTIPPVLSYHMNDEHDKIEFKEKRILRNFVM